ncbi:MAG: hypothetical protein KKE39_10525 [Bacteroidetes bacterium]|nr:hypothetical protein [Bacteroidota bacterium]MBU1373982.1 hypothetical protein [Bacteroidota bacterium]MBU1484678.1 hypothetical protein [Bacteroidota bacterium]MBU1761181.1 hypothetical protein [Bacteroidota bacterium]MBU2268334.1 hypothetical protein [Bacteroidota bacterium]
MKKNLIFWLLFFQVFQISAQNLYKTRIDFRVPDNLNSNDSLFYLAGDFNNWKPNDLRYQFKNQAGGIWNLEVIYSKWTA